MTQYRKFYIQALLIAGLVLVVVAAIILWIFPLKERSTIYNTNGELKPVGTIHTEKFDVLVQPYKQDSITYLIFRSSEGIYVVNYTDDSLAWVFLHSNKTK